MNARAKAHPEDKRSALVQAAAAVEQAKLKVISEVRVAAATARRAKDLAATAEKGAAKSAAKEETRRRKAAEKADAKQVALSMRHAAALDAPRSIFAGGAKEGFRKGAHGRLYPV
jgi:hypothetical protein